DPVREVRHNPAQEHSLWQYGIISHAVERSLLPFPASSIRARSFIDLAQQFNGRELMSKRRDFLKAGASIAVGTLVAPDLLQALGRAKNPERWSEPATDELLMTALNAAKAAGATYADARIGRYRRQSINTRERQITGVSDGESYGIGIRTIVNGAWGFAATSAMTTDGVAKAAREAAR